MVLIECTPPPPFPLWEGGGGAGWASNQILKREGGLIEPQFLEGVAGKEAGNFLRRGFMTEKVYKLKYLSLSYLRI